MPKKHNLAYLSIIGSAFVLGATPAGLTLTIDPYQMFVQKDRPTVINDIAEKAHYPLWKLAKFKRGSHDTIILGDSRARALRDKYWHELKIPGALNLAYGGGTIPEIYSTFKEIKSDPAIRNFIIGVQLRSFDERHKGGMNRVPEAVKLVRHKIEYLKNWDVFQTTWKIFQAESENTIYRYGSLVSPAHAADLGKEGNTSLSKLLEPEVCFGCDLPAGLSPIKYTTRHGSYRLPRHYRNGYHGWGINNHYDWREFQDLYDVTYTLENLPAKFHRQVTKNGKADWRGFQFSKKYWRHFEEIGAWAKSENKNLIFVIPPTIANMQSTIQESGLGKLNHQLRIKLAELGRVVDFDYPNALTQDIGHFNDAYHFNSKVARQIVGQIVPLITDKREVIALAQKREQNLKCDFSDVSHSKQMSETVQLTKGRNCRMWRPNNEQS